MDTFYIIPNETKDVNLEITNRIIDYVEKHGGKCTVASVDEHWHIKPGTVPDKADCAIVLGGDGTMTQAARELRGYNIPILGINMGTLGYMAEVEIDNIEESLQKLLDDEYYMEIRTMIQGSINGESPKTAMNDIVTMRENGLRVVAFNVYVNGELLNTYIGDGVIISTPTGSTGYNLSAGGPILEPSADILVITPICSHSLNTRSIVLSAENYIEIEIGEPRHKGVEQASVSFDAKECIPLVTGDRIRIKKTGESVVFLKLNKESFMRTMCRKMKGN